jgi:hypothetical protein
MATATDHRGVVGYNVQAAVDAKHHLVIANEVTNKGNDRSHLLPMAIAAKAEIGVGEMTALADRGYYEGEQIRACVAVGILPLVPKPNTSPARAKGLWGKNDFTYEPATDTYRCPLGKQLPLRQRGRWQGYLGLLQPAGLRCLRIPFPLHLRPREAHPPMRARGSARRHAGQARCYAGCNGLAALHGRARLRHRKGWMGATHFRMRGVKNVAA